MTKKKYYWTPDNEKLPNSSLALRFFDPLLVRVGPTFLTVPTDPKGLFPYFPKEPKWTVAIVLLQDPRETCDRPLYLHIREDCKTLKGAQREGISVAKALKILLDSGVPSRELLHSKRPAKIPASEWKERESERQKRRREAYEFG